MTDYFVIPEWAAPFVIPEWAYRGSNRFIVISMSPDLSGRRVILIT